MPKIKLVSMYLFTCMYRTIHMKRTYVPNVPDVVRIFCAYFAKPQRLRKGFPPIVKNRKVTSEHPMTSDSMSDITFQSTGQRCSV